MTDIDYKLHVPKMESAKYPGTKEINIEAHGVKNFEKH